MSVQKTQIRKTFIASFAFALVVASGVAVAQAPRSPADAVQYRHDQFKRIGGAFKTLNEQTRASAPDLAIIRTNVATIAQLAPDLPNWFPANSAPAAGLQTHAKAEIWSNAPAFATRVHDFQAAVQALSAASAGSDTAAITASVRAVGQTCGSCHNDFRERS